MKAFESAWNVLKKASNPNYLYHRDIHSNPHPSPQPNPYRPSPETEENRRRRLEDFMGMPPQRNPYDSRPHDTKPTGGTHNPYQPEPIPFQPNRNPYDDERPPWQRDNPQY